MPLVHSSSGPAFKKNVKTLMGEVGKSPHVASPQQALAIAYAEKRRARRAVGGVSQPTPSWTAPGSLAAGTPAAMPSLPQGVAQPAPAWMPSNQGVGSNINPNTATLGTNPQQWGFNPNLDTATLGTQANQWNLNPGAQMASLGTNAQQWGFNTNPQTASLGTTPQQWGFNSGPQTATLGTTPQQWGMAPSPGMKRGGATRRAFGGFNPNPWQVRAEARNLMHTGPILSAVPGRTDRHNMNVPGSSYVFPADFVSHLGQNNSVAGMKILSRMFGPSGGAGPFGAGGMNMPRGAGLPKPPRPMNPLSDRGGARGENRIGAPVPVLTAGGEFVAAPQGIMKALGSPDMNRNHKILDDWVMKVRKDHIRTLQKLPPPAKA